jgi:hypothetical protein
MFAHRTQRAVFEKKLVYTVWMENVATGQFLDDGDAMFEAIEADVASRLEVGGGGVGPCDA